MIKLSADLMSQVKQGLITLQRAEQIQNERDQFRNKLKSIGFVNKMSGKTRSIK